MPAIVPCSLSHSTIPTIFLFFLSIPNKIFLPPPGHLSYSIFAHFPTFPTCHLCSSVVFCLILAPIFMLLHLLHIFTHFQKSPTVSGCPAWDRPLQLTQPHFCVGLSSSPSCCPLTQQRTSSWKIKFLFSCWVHFKLSLHAPIHHMLVIFSSNLALPSQKPSAVLLKQLLKHFYYKDFVCSLQYSFLFQLDVPDVSRLNLLVKSWGMFLTCSQFIHCFVYLGCSTVWDLTCTPKWKTNTSDKIQFHFNLQIYYCFFLTLKLVIEREF